VLSTVRKRKSGWQSTAVSRCCLTTFKSLLALPDPYLGLSVFSLARWLSSLGSLSAHRLERWSVLMAADLGQPLLLRCCSEQSAAPTHARTSSHRCCPRPARCVYSLRRVRSWCGRGEAARKKSEEQQSVAARSVRPPAVLARSYLWGIYSRGTWPPAMHRCHR